MYMRVRWLARLLLFLSAGSFVVSVAGCGRMYQLITGRPRGGVRVVVQVKPLPGGSLDAATLNAVETVFERRGKMISGASYVRVTRRGRDTFVVDVGGTKNLRRARNVFGATGSLEFYHLKTVNDVAARGRNKFAGWIMSVSDDNDYSFTDTRKPGSPPVTDPAEIKKLVIGENTQPILTGRDLVPGKNTVQHSGQSASVLVALTFTPQAQSRFAEFTRRNVHEFLAVTLDGRILTAPRINEAIPGNPVIEGKFTVDEAQELVDLLNTGEMPAAPKVVSARVLP
ncbi:MAG: hypothetical protein Q7T82_07315 [Armatimonadota bacterium]|nr:hypothetical protein [Armatimonadota bacterium]